MLLIWYAEREKFESRHGRMEYRLAWEKGYDDDCMDHTSWKNKTGSLGYGIWGYKGKTIK